MDALEKELVLCLVLVLRVSLVLNLRDGLSHVVLILLLRPTWGYLGGLNLTIVYLGLWLVVNCARHLAGEHSVVSGVVLVFFKPAMGHVAVSVFERVNLVLSLAVEHAAFGYTHERRMVHSGCDRVVLSVVHVRPVSIVHFIIVAVRVLDAFNVFFFGEPVLKRVELRFLDRLWQGAPIMSVDVHAFLVGNLQRVHSRYPLIRLVAVFLSNTLADGQL